MENCNILIVDNSIQLRETLAYFFKKSGFTAFEAGNGHIAMEILKAADIRLIISDIRMPDADGLSLLQEIRENNSLKHIPLIFVTGFADISNDEAYQRGANDIFPKPFDPEDILHSAINLLMPSSKRWASNTTSNAYKQMITLKSDQLQFNNPGHLINFGNSGFFIHCEEQLPEVGDLIRSELQFANGDIKELICLGKVAWTRKKSEGKKAPGYGVKIIELDPEVKASFLEQLELLKIPATIPTS
ncbi:MAG: PleD family two-component system response regulator [Oligoflexales bacterium]